MSYRPGLLASVSTALLAAQSSITALQSAVGVLQGQGGSTPAPTPVLTINTPSGVQLGASYSIVGTYAHEASTPTLLVSVDGGAPAALPQGSSVASANAGAGGFTLMMGGGLNVGTHPIYVQDQNGVRSNTVNVMIAAPNATVPAAPTLASPVAGNGTVAHTLTNGANGGAAITAHTLYAAASQSACQAAITAKTGVPLTLGAGGTFTRAVTNGATEWIAVTATNSAGEGPPSNFAWGQPEPPSVSAPLGPDLLMAGDTYVTPGPFAGVQALASGSGRVALPMLDNTPFALSMRFKASAIPSAYTTLAQITTALSSEGAHISILDGSGDLEVHSSNGNRLGTGPNVTDNTFHHLLAQQYPQGGMNVYLDGTLAISSGGSTGTTGTRLVLTCPPGFEIAEVALYNTVVQPDGSNFTPSTSPIPASAPGLVGLWRFNGNGKSGDSTGGAAPASGTAAAGSAGNGPGLVLTNPVFGAGVGKAGFGPALVGGSALITPQVSLAGQSWCFEFQYYCTSQYSPTIMWPAADNATHTLGMAQNTNSEVLWYGGDGNYQHGALGWPTDNAFHAIAVQWNEATRTIELYVDGTPLDTHNYASGITFAPEPVFTFLAAGASAVNLFGSQTAAAGAAYSEIALFLGQRHTYPDTFTPSTTPYTGSEPNLIGLWHLTDATDGGGSGGSSGSTGTGTGTGTGSGGGTGGSGSTPSPTPSVALAPGIHFPDTVYTTPDFGGYGQTMCQGVVVGLDPTIVPTITLTGTAGTNFYQTGANELAIAYGIYQAAGSWSCEWTATDGTTTFTWPFTVVSRATGGAVNMTTNVLTDGAPINGYFGAYRIADNTGPETFSDPSGFFVLGDFQQIRLADPASVPANLGMRTFTLTYPVAGGTHVETVPMYLVHEPNPAVSIVFQPMYDWASPGDVLATVTAFSVSGIASMSLAQSDGTISIAFANGVGTIRALSAQTAGAKTLSVLVTSNTGKSTTTPPTNYSIGAGTILPASNMTAAFSTSLNNGMNTAARPGAINVGSVTVTGMTNPVWTITPQGEIPIYQTTPASTLYNTPRSNPTTTDVGANFLSGRTYQVVCTATEGAKLCTKTVPLAVADVNGTGEAVTVTPGAARGTTVQPSWNAALDRLWEQAIVGGTVLLPGGPYNSNFDAGGGIFEFNRRQEGHGSNQQYPPGPYTLKGPSATNPTILTFNGAPGLQAQGGLIAQGGDIVFMFLVIRNVSNLNQGEGNAGAILKVGQQPYDVSAIDCKFFNSDMGFLTGRNELSTVTLTRVVTAFNGIGAGGLTHNIYAGHAGRVVVDDMLSFGTAQVHEFKCRAAVCEINNSRFFDTNNGNPGGSSVLDFPVCGDVTVTNTILHKGPSPNNDGNMVQYGAEAVGANGPAWDENTLILDGVLFINTAAPGSFTSSVTGITFVISEVILSPKTGLPATIIFRNCTFYALPKDQWVRQSPNGVNLIIDGGNNTHVTTWPGLDNTDPSTGQPLTTALAPLPSYGSGYLGSNGYNGQGLLVAPNKFQAVIPAHAAVGTHIEQFYTSDVTNQPLNNPAFSLMVDQVNIGATAMNPSTGELTVAAGQDDGLYWARLQVTGMDNLPTPQSRTYSKYISYVVGNGKVPGRDTAGGPVTVA